MSPQTTDKIYFPPERIENIFIAILFPLSEQSMIALGLLRQTQMLICI